MNIKRPDLLDRDAYYKAYAEFLYLRKIDREFYLSIAKEALNGVFNKESD